MPKKMLVVYYSWTNGNTEKIAEQLADACEADIEAACDGAARLTRALSPRSSRSSTTSTRGSRASRSSEARPRFSRRQAGA